MKCELCCEDLYDDYHTCAGCDCLCCPDCLRWCHAEDDPPNGDWFCVECIEAYTEKE